MTTEELAKQEGTGAGPYCPLCGNASADLAAHPDTFDIHDHVQRCKARIRRRERRETPAKEATA